MREIVSSTLQAFDLFVLVYFLVLNSWYFVLVVLASAELWHAKRRESIAGHDDALVNPFTPAVTVILPAHDEEAVIVESVRAMRSLRYPHVEVIVVDDGSTDRTFDVLREELDLVQIPKVIPQHVPVVQPVTSSWVPRSGEPLLVLRKAAGGSKTDPLNAGINAASSPLVCLVDADAVLDDDALLKVVKPFIDDPLRVVATGGTIRAVNGSVVDRGRVVDARMPREWLARIQVVEYLRAFLLGRIGWARLRGLLIISGAFGVFRRDVLIEVGGMAHGTIGEDAELVARIHRKMGDEDRPYRVEFVADPVCWTEVPTTLRVLGSQRRRWARGLVETLRRHQSMLLRPRYGSIGMLAMPYFLLFEVIGPVIELAGVVTVILGLGFGLLDVEFALLFFLVAFGYGAFLSVVALAVEEATYHRFGAWRDLLVAVVAAVIENLWYRQLHAWWRLRGLVAAMRGREAAWGRMTRTGFRTAEGP
jgi:cellulose synthase/poly-beta-1,6-N-acetylglucosamine synthase-like glycosyltransferase